MSNRRKGFDTSLSSSAGGGGSKPNGRSSQAVPPTIPSPKTIEPTATVPTETQEEDEGQTEIAAPTQEEMDDTYTCFICAEPIIFWSTGVCGHKTCHVCALRLRIFYKKTDCTYCKTPQPSLYFSGSPTTPFPADHQLQPTSPAVIAAAQARAEKEKNSTERWDRGLTLPGKLDLTAFDYKDEKTSIVFETAEMADATMLLLRFNCPHSDCAHMSDGWPNLGKHTLAVHGLTVCMICCRKLSRFSHEQVLYPPHLLSLHDPSRLHRGQRPPKLKGAEVEMIKHWDAPHPMCEFCHEAFFGPDEMFQHMRTKHDECFVCKDLGERHVYFQNYAKLEAHFNTDHFACRDEACLEQKFVVFGSELDLRAHVIEAHKGTMTSRQQAQSRQIQVDFSDQSHRSGPSRQGAGQGQGRGFTLQPRGSEAPQQQQITEHAPMGGAQAAQARRQAQTDRQEESNRRRRAFNTNLTETQRESEREVGSGFNTPREDVDEATAMRHAALISRVSYMVSDSVNKMSSFRSAIRAFKNTESTAKGMIDTIYNVLDQDHQATISVVKEIGQIFEEDGSRDKAKDILEAINGFRAQQEQQFPSLGGPSGLGSNYAGITSGQILRAKNTTHTSNRSGSSRSVWDRVEAAAASRPAPTGQNQRVVPGSRAALSASTAFPGLGAAPSSRSSTPHSTPWASGGAGTTSKAPPALAGPQIRSVNFPTGKSSTKSKPPSQGAFPSLPSSSRPSMSAQERKALFSKPAGREASDWTGSGGMEGLSMNGGGDAEGVQQNGGKKKGKQKQILFSVSARPQ